MRETMCKNIKKTALATSLMLAGTLLYSGNSYACCAGSLIGKAASIQGSLLGSLSAMDSAIAAQLKLNGMDAVKGLEGIRKAVAQASTGQTEEMINQNRINEREKALYEAKLKVIEDYGNPPESVCADAGKGAIIEDVGKSAQKQSSERSYRINERIRGTSFSGHKLNPEAASFVSTTEIAAVKDEDLIIDRLGDPELDEPSRRKLLALATDPRPPAPLDDNRKSTAAGRLYEALRKERLVKMSTVGAAFSEISRQEAPADGKDAPSLSVMLEQLVEDAYPSAAWHGEIQAMGRTDLLREMAKQVAIGNLLEREMYRLERRLLQLEAAAGSVLIDNEYRMKLEIVFNRIEGR